MTDSSAYQQAVQALKDALVKAQSYTEYKQIVEAREQVLPRYGQLFARANLPNIREDEFRGFLHFKNNQHWSGLHRQGSRICADMDVLHDVLFVLLDEERPIAERVDQAINRVMGMGKAIVTAILHVALPHKYGVWNTTSEGGLKHLGLWPPFERGTSAGACYERINGILVSLARDLDLDLWTLDTLLWVSMPEEDRPAPANGSVIRDEPQVVGPIVVVADEIAEAQRFALEAHLQEFLWANWDQTELGKQWEKYTEPGDERRGYEYPCDVGRVDILAKHRTEPRWLVVELKRGQTSDQTVGQVLRYMGWIRHELAFEGETVEGLVIALDADTKLRYALEMVPNVNLMQYEVKFQLAPVARFTRRL